MSTRSLSQSKDSSRSSFSKANDPMLSAPPKQPTHGGVHHTKNNFSVQEEQDDSVFSRDAQILLQRKGSFLKSLNSSSHTNRGWLKKLASHGKRWNRRYFVCHGHYLSYFLNEDGVGDSNKNLLGSLDLWRVENVTLEDSMIVLEFSNNSSSNNKNIPLFRKRSSLENRILLQATDSKEASHWVSFLKCTPLQLEPEVNDPQPTTILQPSEGDFPSLHPGFVISLLTITLNNKRELNFTQVSETTRFRLGEAEECDLVISVVSSSATPTTTTTLRHHVVFDKNSHNNSVGVEIKLNNEWSVEFVYEVDQEISVDELIRKLVQEEDPHPLILQIPLAALLFSVTLVISHYVLDLSLIKALLGSLLVSIPAVALLGEIFHESSMTTSSSSPTTATATTPRYVLSRFRVVQTERRNKMLTSERVEQQTREARRRQSSQLQQEDCSILPGEVAKLAEFRQILIRGSDIYKRQVFVDLALASKRMWPPDDANSVNMTYEALLEKYISCDFRLVRFLRARDMNPLQAEKLLRTSLLWRLSNSTDTLLDTYTLPPWVAEYASAKLVTPSFCHLSSPAGSQMRLDQWWLRDKQGSLAMFFRLGHFDWKRFYYKLNQPELLLKMGIWVLELGRLDLDYHHQVHHGTISSYSTLVFDMAGFSLTQQLPVVELLPLLRRFFILVSTSYPEQIKRVLMVNAPFLFHGLWGALKNFVPEEVQRKVLILSGKCDFNKHLSPYFYADQVPEYLGGSLRGEHGDPYCKNRLPPSGPFLDSDRGAKWLE